MRIFHLSAECFPVAKVGGLADVVGALPKYQVAAGLQAAVVLPFYDRKFTREHQFDAVFQGLTLLGTRRLYFQILKETNNTLGFELYLVKIPGLIDREEVYCYPDETDQFIAYQIAFLDWINWSGQTPDLIHCHDHHSGLVPFLLQFSGAYKRLANVPTVLTIHNGQYHGATSWEKLSLLPEVDMSKTGLLDWNGALNPLATAVKCCKAFTTVSPTYLQELTKQSNGLEYLFYLEGYKGTGILNGIDTEVWNPSTDTSIAAKYSATSITQGKNKNKTALCNRFGLKKELPLIVFIGRLVVDKGADLLAPAIERALTEYNGQVNFLMLGAGDKPNEAALLALKDKFPEHYGVFIGYDEALAHLCYAGADFLLMPSRVEPCGLNQLYSLRYGTLPIVRTTGGLKDSVIDFGDTGGYGIRFNNASVDDISYSVGRAIVLYNNKTHLQKLRKTMMALDFSWNRSTSEYITLYNRIISAS